MLPGTFLEHSLQKEQKCPESRGDNFLDTSQDLDVNKFNIYDAKIGYNGRFSNGGSTGCGATLEFSRAGVCFLAS